MHQSLFKRPFFDDLVLNRELAQSNNPFLSITFSSFSELDTLPEEGIGFTQSDEAKVFTMDQHEITKAQLIGFVRNLFLKKMCVIATSGAVLEVF